MVDSPTRRSKAAERSRMITRNAGFFCNRRTAVAAPESAPPMIATSYDAGSASVLERIGERGSATVMPVFIRVRSRGLKSFRALPRRLTTVAAVD